MKKFLTYGAFMLVGALISATTAFALIQVKKFPDVNYNSYYGSSVDKMVAKGVIRGYDNGNFGPDDAVTRAQFVTMLDRYDQEVDYMKTIICDGIERNSLANTQIYDKLCPPLAE